MSDFYKVVDHLIINEGGFVDHIMDRGGATIYGVTLKNWRLYTGRKVSLAEFRSLEPRDVKEFYKTEYWDKVQGDKLISGINYYVFDYAVNSGVSRSSKALQRIVGTSPDGIIGNVTIQAVYDYVSISGTDALIKAIDQSRRETIKTFWNYQTFKRGWINRLNSVLNKSLEIAEKPLVEIEDLSKSRTMKAGKRTVATTVATGTIAATEGVKSISQLPEVATVVSDLQTAQTVVRGVEGLFSYGFYVGIGVIVVLALYMLYLRHEDWFMGKR